MARRNDRKTEGSFSDLFFDNISESSDSASTLRISEVEPNKGQPRKDFDKEKLQQLADSISELGVIEPLIVRSMPNGGYQIIAGERRWRAAKMAGLSEIPVVIRDDLTEEQAMLIAMIENLQRENLNPIEEAQGYKTLIEKYNMTQDALAKMLGKARSTITNSLGLLEMPNAVQELLKNGKLSTGHCKVLKMVKDEALMIELAHKTAEGHLSVRQVETIAKREARGENEGRTIPKMPKYYAEVIASLTEILGTRVNISMGKKENALQISFKDEEGLRNIASWFLNE